MSRWVGLLALLYVSGCHWIAPLGAPPNDGRPGEPVAAVDAARLDGRAPDQDLPLCDDSDPLVNPSCTESCAGGDCDGLPNARDPWPTTCNRAVLAEPFLDHTAAWLGRSYCDSSIRASCGELRVRASTNMTLWAWITPSGIAVPAQDLVELRVRPVSVTLWKLGLVVRANALSPAECFPFGSQHKGYRECGIDRSTGSVTLINDVDGQTAAGSIPSSALADFVIQSYVDGSLHHCRLVSEGTVVADTTQSMSGLPDGATLLVSFTNESQQSSGEIALDFLRVFAP